MTLLAVAAVLAGCGTTKSRDATQQLLMSDSVDRSIATIVTQVEAMKNMVNDFRDYAKTPPPSLAAVDLDALVREVLALYEAATPRVETSLAAALPRVRADANQLESALLNLAVNARDAIAEVGNLIIATENMLLDEADCADTDDCLPGRYVRLTVGDNGCGMDKEILANLFEPFFTTKGIGEGTGLGLATVYGVVKQNDGFLNVYTEPGQGTTFRIYFPRHIGRTEEVHNKQSSKRIAGGKETILLVEDEPAILKMGR